MGRRLLFSLVAILAAGLCESAIAQNNTMRFGIGTGLVLNPSNDSIADDEVGLAVLIRLSKPVNADVSLAAGVGLFAFAFNGTEHADYVVNPQVSLVVTLGGEKRFPYLLAGVGGLFPTDSAENAQFAIHIGYGWIWPMKSASAFFEINPSLAFQANSTTIILPLRIGLIF